jgi:hypothetical protein
LIALTKPDVVDSDISAAAKLLSVARSVFVSMFEAEFPLPLARIESQDLADEMVRRLTDLGFALAVVADTDLRTERPPVRLRNIAINAEQLELTDFNSDKSLRVDREEIKLIVTGRILHTRREERTQRKKRKTKILDETETGSDRRLIDLYTSQESIGFRIQTNGFDFSLLGDEKGMLANENIQKLADLLGQNCPSALVADEYDSVRNWLDAVWDLESDRDVRVRNIGKREFETSYTSSNLTQFTKYSRMRRLLI